MERKLDLKLIFVGILVHAIIFYSIFDVYFKSPLVHGARPIEKLSLERSPAKRLVLFVADGLRADTFFNLIERDPSLYLSKKRNGDAAFAMSNTQVPTESRPGHVAMIAGFYEDLSAVAKGWKENPVDFDSVFNRSRYTWSWGSPDILNMFTRSSKNVFIKTYDSSIEDFASENATVLDTWVLHHFKKFLYHSEVNVTETKMLHEEQVVFFFHFLGIDTNGHSKKPHSNDYVSNVVLVDGIVAEITQILDKYFDNDNETTFIFTSDHGMTDWGSHGSGDDSETLTPFVAWGNGINHHKYDRSNLINVKQADIAPFMSYLIGVPIPINSIGKIPISLINATDEEKCLTYKMNALQIIEQLKIKHNQCKNSAIFFKEFNDLTMLDIKEIIMAVDTLIESKSYKMAIDKLDSLIDLSLQALDYYHKYNKFYLGTCILFSCVAWIVYLLMHNLLNINHDDAITSLKRKQLAEKINLVFIAAIVLSVVLSFYQQFPIMYYVYTLLPLLLWRSIFLNFKILGYLIEIWSSHKIRNSINFLILLLGIECLVMTFFHRWIFSVVLVCYSVYLVKEVASSKQTLLKWAIVASPLLLAVFPLLPVIKGHTHLYLVYFSMIVMNLLYVWLLNKLEILKRTKLNSMIILVLNAITLINVFWIRKSVEHNAGLPRLGQILSCLVVVSCLVVPVLSKPLLKRRLVYVLFSLANIYFHLSISYESLFVLVLCLQMISWLTLESFKACGQFNIDLALAKARSSRIVGHDEEEFENLTWSNTFRVFLLVLHLLVAFFGTGNMASINSFDPVSVYCFLTVFNPFVMGFFLFLKIVIPFLIVIVVFYCIYDVINISLKTSYTFLMIISDMMALHFFFLIRTEGSWLDIGTSISHYIIVMTKIIFVSLLFSVANFIFTFELTLPGTGLLSSLKSRIVKSD